MTRNLGFDEHPKGCMALQSSERTAPGHGGATGVSEAKIDSTFSGAGMTGATSPDGGARGENPPQETRDPAEASQDVVKRRLLVSSLRRKAKDTNENHERGLVSDR